MAQASYYVLKHRVLKGPFSVEQLRAACARGDFQSLDYAIAAEHVEQGVIKYVRLGELSLGLSFAPLAAKTPVVTAAPGAADANERQLSSGFGDDEERPQPGNVTRVFTEALEAADLLSVAPANDKSKAPPPPRAPEAHGESPFAPPVAEDWRARTSEWLTTLRGRVLKPALLLGAVGVAVWGALQWNGKGQKKMLSVGASSSLPPPTMGAPDRATPGSASTAGKLPPPNMGTRMPASLPGAAQPATNGDNYDPPNPNDIARQEEEAARAVEEEEARKARTRRAKSGNREPAESGEEDEPAIDAEGGGG